METPNNTPAPDATPTPTPDVTPDATPQTPTPDAPAANPAPDGTGQTDKLRNDPQPGDVDYKTKFAASTTENQRYLDMLRQNGIDPKTGQKAPDSTPPQTVAPATPTPTAPVSYEQAVAQIPGFSTLSDQEKALVLNPRQAYRDIEQVTRQVAEMYDERETNKQVKELVGKDDYKDLDQEKFKEFIYREENLGVKNLETLAKMFKLEEAETPPEPPTPEGAEPTTAGAKEIATGTGVQEVSVSEAQQLRTQDPKRYAQLIRTGKLRINKD